MSIHLFDVRGQMSHIEYRWLNTLIPYNDVYQPVAQWIPFIEIVERIINIAATPNTRGVDSDVESTIEDCITELAENHAEILAEVDTTILLHIEDVMVGVIDRLIELDLFGNNVKLATRLFYSDLSHLLIHTHSSTRITNYENRNTYPTKN